MLSRTLPFHSFGGMQLAAWDLARGLVAAGVPVTFLTTSVPGRAEQFEESGVEVVAFRDAPPERYTRPWWVATRTYFRRALRADEVAALSVSAGGYGLLPIREELSIRPLVLQAHGTSIGELVSKWRTGNPIALAKSVKNGLWALRDLASYRRFDSVVAVGERVRADLTRPPVRWVLPRDRVMLIPNGVDTDRFFPDRERGRRIRATLGVPEGEPLVISTSRLHPQKRVDLTIQGFAALLAQSVSAHLLIVGDGPDRAKLEKVVRERKLMDRVTFTGAVGVVEMPDILRAADALILTSTREEGLPLVVLEALATGVPTVVSSHLESMITANPAVIAVDPRKSDAVARGIQEVLSIAWEPCSLLPPEYGLQAAIEQYRRLLEV